MEIMDEESVKLLSIGDFAHIAINRPRHLNALNPDVLQSIILLLDKLQKDRAIKSLVISGQGDKAFAAGADVAAMAQLGPRPIAEYVELGQRTMRAIECARFPVIAAVQGYALGGGLELALACDLIIAAENAKFGQPEVNLGIIPGFGATQRLLQRCGIGAARRLIYSGEIISAAEALQIGLVDKVVPLEDLISASKTVAGTIADKAPLAVQRAKRVIRQSQEQMLLAGLRLEVEGFLEVFATSDREEGMTAFLQKRAAKFRGT